VGVDEVSVLELELDSELARVLGLGLAAVLPVLLGVLLLLEPDDGAPSTPPKTEGGEPADLAFLASLW